MARSCVGRTNTIGRTGPLPDAYHLVAVGAKKRFSLHEASSAANGALAENVHGIRAIQELVREDINFDLFEVKARTNLLTHFRASKFTNVIIPIVDTLTGAAMAIVIVVGGTMVLDKSLDIGVMVAFLFYVQRFFDSIRR